MNESKQNEGKGLFMLKKPPFHPNKTYVMKVDESFAHSWANLSRIFQSFPVLSNILRYLTKLGKI